MPTHFLCQSAIRGNIETSIILHVNAEVKCCLVQVHGDGAVFCRSHVELDSAVALFSTAISLLHCQASDAHFSKRVLGLASKVACCHASVKHTPGHSLLAPSCNQENVRRLCVVSMKDMRTRSRGRARPELTRAWY